MKEMTPLPNTTVPATTTSSGVTSVPSPDVMEFFEDAVVRLRDYGPLRVGARVDDLQREFGIILSEGECPPVFGIGNGPSNVSVMVNGERVSRITIVEPTSNPDDPINSNPILGVTTLSGVAFGSTKQQVMATYGDQVILEAIPGDEMSPDGERRLTFVPRDEVDAHLRLIFTLDDQDRVSNMRTGVIDAVQKEEPCV